MLNKFMKMKKKLILFIVLCAELNAMEVENPVVHFASLGDPSDAVQARYAQIGFKVINIDINGDGKLDVLLCFDDPEQQDSTEVQSQEQEPGVLHWDVYVRNPGNTAYIVSRGLEVEGQISVASGLPLNPECLFIGLISEINCFGITSINISNPRAGASIATIFAYTWEGDHMKCQKLAEYASSKENQIFNKHLAEDKRTVLQVQQVTP
jgi:hypothetical protein